MVATPKTGTLIFRGRSGKAYSYSIYNSDVAAAFVTFATTGAAGTGSVNFITAPEDMVLEDISVVTGIVDTTSLVLWLDDGPVPGTVIQWANVVNTQPFRNFPKFGIKQGRKVQLAEA
jgi:hypothetical protein